MIKINEFDFDEKIGDPGAILKGVQTYQYYHDNQRYLGEVDEDEMEEGYTNVNFNGYGFQCNAYGDCSFVTDSETELFYHIIEHYLDDGNETDVLNVKGGIVIDGFSGYECDADELVEEFRKKFDG